MLTGRLREIVSRVDHSGQASVSDLAKQCDVAVETIRRDLRQLEDAGYLRRTHGGAASLLDRDDVLAFGMRRTENSEAKKQMAQHALTQISEHDVLLLDPSSSCWYLAAALPDMPLTVITNSVRILFDLVHKKNIKPIGVGGHYSEKYGAFLGAITVAHIQEFQADICFFSCAAYSEERGAWDSNDLNAGVKKAILRSSRRNVLLCDKSKYGRSGFTLIASPNNIDCMVNEDGLVRSDHASEE